MDDLISRQAAIDAHCELCDMNDKCICIYCKDIDMFESLPTAGKKGKWEVCDILDYAQRPSGRKILRCPFCGYLTGEFRSMVDYYHKLTHFCPNCGAEMEGGERSKHG